MNNYIKLLKHPKWQKKRLKILKRDNFTCQLCNDKNTTLHIHHQKYIPHRKPWQYNNEYLITLCEDCHKLVEIIIKQDPPPFNIFNSKILKINTNSDFIIFFLFELNGLERCIIYEIQDQFKYYNKLNPPNGKKIHRY
jgi:hypothetical protein